MSMAYLMKKEEFLALIAGMKSPRLTRTHIQVYVYDDKPESKEIQVPARIYCASNFREESYIAAQNKMNKFREWMEAAK